MQHIEHLVVARIIVLVNFQHLVRVAFHIGLVEHTEHLLNAVVHIAVKTGNLNNDAVVREALDERLRVAVLNHIAVVVVDVMVDINYRLLYVAHLMAEKVDSHHGIGKAVSGVIAHVAFVAVLSAKVLAETQSLGVEPCLLQLYQHDAVLRRVTFALTHSGREVNAEH